MRGTIFLSFVLLFCALGVADPLGRSCPVSATATLHGLEGHRLKLAAPQGGATVLVFYSTECPISNSYSPTLKSLVESFPAEKVKWIGVCVDPDLSDADVKAHASDFSLNVPDRARQAGALARKLGAKVTPEAFVIDDEGQVRYHGRIDDQFAARQKRNANPTANDLKDALDCALERKGRRRRIRRGRRLPDARGPARQPRPTYSKDVAPIIQKNCQECHRPGQVGPFPLETYEQARKRASDIAAVVDDRADAALEGIARTSAPSSATFARFPSRKSPRSSPGPKATRPRATRPTCRPPPKFPDDWELGTPDLVLDTGADYEVPATGEDIYRCFVVPTGLTKTSTSRPSNSARETAASCTTSWPTSMFRVKHASAIKPTRARAIRASAAPATRSTATWAAGRPETGPAFSTRASDGRCPARAT